MRHLIKKQIIELQLDKGLNYYQVQQQVSDRYWNEMVPLLEKAFDSVSREDEIVEIDKFELDLGNVSEDKIGGDDWIEEIRKKVEEKLAAILNPSSSQYSVRLKDRRLGIIDQWFYYMDHGYLPWNSGKLDDNWHQDVLEALAIDIGSFQKLKQKIHSDTSFLKRVVTQHHQFFLQKLTEIITAEKQESLGVYIDELIILSKYLSRKRKITLNDSDRELKDRYWQSILRSASEGTYPGTLSGELIRRFVEEKMVVTKIPASTAAKLPHIMPMLNLCSEDLKVKLKKEKIKIGEIVQDLSIPDKIDERQNVREQIQGLRGKAVEEEGIFTVNAGVVLLHPFLKTLFSRLELINGSEFVNDWARETCLYLIHYLATGSVEAKEYELTLPKLLCGYPLEIPVGPYEELDNEYIFEADGLLEAAIGQWNILKNTSIRGLREGFLQRPGMLFSKNGDYYLRIEKSSIDVLLDYLQWNLGMIMLPWMKDILRVEWR